MEASKIADVLVSLGLINGHDIDGAGFGTSSTKPHGKMCFLAEEIVLLPSVVDDVRDYCVRAGYPLRLSYRDGKYICIAEKSWITVENKECNRAIIEACARTLEEV
jgi:hypothetical protein